jgi:hypothetical protein
LWTINNNWKQQFRSNKNRVPSFPFLLELLMKKVLPNDDVCVTKTGGTDGTNG